MDFTRTLSAFHGALISADNVYSFASIYYKGGNEEKVNYITNSLKKFLMAEKYMDKNGLIDDMQLHNRKFFLYIIFNGDLPILKELAKITVIEPVIWSIPTLGKYLMCEIIWQLQMDQFVYELIPSGWPQLGIQVAGVFLENFKHFKPTECLYKLQRLCVACYTLVCRLTAFNIENENENMLKDIFQIIQKYIKYYNNPPNEHLLHLLNADDLYKYKANRFKSIMSVILECCNLFTQKISFIDDHPVYKLTYIQHNITAPTCKVCDTTNTAVLECLKNINTILLDNFQSIVMEISVDIFCAWSEYEEDGKTLQQSVGEMCNKLHIKLQNISSMSGHTVLAMLQLMARKPTDINELISTVDTNTILEKINSNREDSQLWIRALANKENLSQFDELLDVVDANLRIFNEKESFALFNKIKHSERDNIAREDFLISLTIKLFEKCNVDDKHRILKERFKDKIFFNIDLPCVYNLYEEQTNAIFNKIISDVNADFTGVLTAFYKRPSGVYAKIFGLASQAPLINPMLQVMELLKDYADYYYKRDNMPCIVSYIPFVVKCTMKKKIYKNIVKFICELIMKRIVSDIQLLIIYIMPEIHEALVLKNTPLLYAVMKLLIAAYPARKLSCYKGPVVVNLAQILMVVRKADVSIKEYDIEALQVVEIVLIYLKSIITEYKDQFSEPERDWIKYKLISMNLSPLNIYYFNSFWNNNHTRLFESATGEPVLNDGNLDVLASKLRQMLPWATLDEWCEFWNYFIAQSIKITDALRIFNSAMYSIVSVINTYHTEKTRSALLHCYKNFVYIIRYKYFGVPLQRSNVQLCMSLLAQNLDITKDADVIEIETLVLPLFSYLSELDIDYKNDVINYFLENRYITAAVQFENIPNEE